MRVALYSHDTLGLGHLRRNLLIAQALSNSQLEVTNLLITGAHEANFFNLPNGADCLTLPRLQKGEDGSYASGKLDISVSDLVRLRSEAIYSALKAFQPDLLIVDKVPGGAFGELLPTLRHIAHGRNTKCVLGIRDVLDDPATVRSEWDRSASDETVRQFYDEIWIYGDQQIYDPVEEYGWSSEVASKVQHTGYLDQSVRVTKECPEPESEEWITKLRQKHETLIVCTLGGGKDGYRLAETFLEAIKQSNAYGVLLTGPFMPRKLLRGLHEMAKSQPNVSVVEFTAEADQLIRLADGVVAMAGYNTVCSILSFRKRALLVPRVYPRQEQWIRATRLQQLGLADVVHPDELNPASIQAWIHQISTDESKVPRRFDMNGLGRVVEYASSLITGRSNQRPAEQRELP